MSRVSLVCIGLVLCLSSLCSSCSHTHKVRVGIEAFGVSVSVGWSPAGPLPVQTNVVILGDPQTAKAGGVVPRPPTSPLTTP